MEYALIETEINQWDLVNEQTWLAVQFPFNYIDHVLIFVGHGGLVQEINGIC